MHASGGDVERLVVAIEREQDLPRLAAQLRGIGRRQPLGAREQPATPAAPRARADPRRHGRARDCDAVRSRRARSPRAPGRDGRRRRRSRAAAAEPSRRAACAPPAAHASPACPADPASAPASRAVRRRWAGYMGQDSVAPARGRAWPRRSACRCPAERSRAAAAGISPCACNAKMRRSFTASLGGRGCGKATPPPPGVAMRGMASAYSSLVGGGLAPPSCANAYPRPCPGEHRCPGE